jgi:parallel beta-helix repeat protein
MLTMLLIGTLASTLDFLSSEAEETMHIGPEAIGINGLTTTDWNETYGGTGDEVACSLVQTGDGGYALAGYTNSSGAGSNDFWLVKTDSSGAMMWNKTYGGTGNDYALSLVRTSDGGYALAGYTYSFGAGCRFWLVKTDSSGVMMWNKTYAGPSSSAAQSVVQTSDGGYALAGFFDFAYEGGYFDFALVKTYPNGTVQWTKTYGGASFDVAQSVIQTGDGGYALAGYTNSYGAGIYDFWLVKTDGSGNYLWNRTYGGTAYDQAWSVVQTGDGGYALAGYTNSSGAGSNDFWLVKTDSSGAMMWNKTYGGTSYDVAYSVVQTSDGGYALAGYTKSFGAGGYDFWLIKLTPSTICIRPDGSVDPPTAPIQRNGDLYTFTDNIYSSCVDGIVIMRNNMVLDGAGHLLDGGGSYDAGIDLFKGTTNVTVKNVDIHAFSLGIFLKGSSYNMIIENNVTDCPYGIELMSSSGNTLAGNRVTDSDYYGILLCLPESGEGSSNNTITGNTLTNNVLGIALSSSSNNFVSGNIIETSNDTGIWIEYSPNNILTGNNLTYNRDGIQISSCTGSLLYHNNFINNWNEQASSSEAQGIWDEGYPQGGNYWSDYNGTDSRSGPYQNETGSDGIGDTHYVIDVDNQDNYPLMKAWSPQYTRYPWPMFHQNPEHTGYTESPAPNTNKKLWNYTTGNRVFSSPAVVSGRVYVGSEDGKVYCLDAYTGAHIWNYTTGSYAYSSPAVVGGRVYVGSEDGKVYCLDAYTGAHIWSYITASSVFSSPAVVGGRVYVGSDDNKIYCLDALTGAHIWSYTTSNAVQSCPAVVDGRVYVGSYDRRVYCLDASTGVLIWNYTTGGIVLSSPAVVGGKVYVGSNDYRVYCLDALTGLQIWNYATSNWVRSSPAVASGKVYVGSDDGKVYCLDASTGAHIWNYTTSIGVVSSPAVVDGKVYVGSFDYRVYCLDGLSGSQIWNYTTGYYVYSSPAVADGVVFIGSQDKGVYALGNVTRVPEDYKTLQKAVDAASPGDTIVVAPGVYHETIIVNKTITILGEKGTDPVFEGGGSGIFMSLLSGASGSTIAGLVITNYDQGILVVNANNLKIYSTTMSLMKQNGIALTGTNTMNNNIYGNIFESNAVAANFTASSTGNVFYKNIILGNIADSVGLSLESSGNIVYANTISQNQVGIRITAGFNTIYHNNFINNVGQTSILTNAYNKWDNDYPSGGSYWSSYIGSDEKSGPNQDQTGKDGINDTSYTIATNNVDRYPLMKPFNAHDIGIVNFYKSKTVVDQGYSMNISLTILNYGMYDETFTVECHAGTTTIGTQIVELAERNCTTVTFTWKTTGVAKGNYTLSAYAGPVQDETDPSDNSLATGWIIVAMVGDITGPNPWVPDGRCEVRDVSIVAALYGAKYPEPRYQPNADIVYDGRIDVRDVALVAARYGQKDP